MNNLHDIPIAGYPSFQKFPSYFYNNNNKLLSS